jgi:hypothetical protein
MIARIIHVIDAATEALPIATRNGWVEVLNFDGRKLPARQKGKDHVPVIGDKWGSVSYWRTMNKVTSRIVSGVVGDEEEATVSLRFVAVLDRSGESGCEDINDALSGVRNSIYGAANAVKVSLGASQARVEVVGMDTESASVFNEEVGVGVLPSKWKMVSMDVRIVVRSKPGCLPSCHETVVYAVPGQSTECPVLRICGTPGVGQVPTWNGAQWASQDPTGGGSGITQLTGDVTAGPGSGSQVATIAHQAVTFAKIQHIATGHLLGRHASGTGDVQEIHIDGGLQLNGINLRRAALTGDVTASAGSNATTIASQAVTNAKLTHMPQATIKGRQAGAGTGDPEDLTASQARTAMGLGTAAVVNTGTGAGDVPTTAQGDARYAAIVHTHAQSDVIGLVTDLGNKQPLDADLTAIAALAPANDDIIQRKAGVWTNRTVAQLLTDLGLGALYQPLSSVLTTLSGASANGQSLVTAANYASMRTLLGLGTAAQVNTGTGAGDVPTITQADLRYAALVHTHVIADVTGLQTALDAKQKTITSGTAAPSGGVDGDIYLQYT